MQRNALKCVMQWKHRIKVRSLPGKRKIPPTRYSPDVQSKAVIDGDMSFFFFIYIYLAVPHANILTKLQRKNPLPKGTVRNVSAEIKFSKSW